MNGTLLKRKRPLEANFELQITALVDTLVIILIFMLKSVSIESLEIDLGKNIAIPTVNGGVHVGSGGRLNIATDGVTWNDNQIFSYQGFKAASADWNKLGNAMGETVEREKKEKKFDGTVLLQADKNTPYPLVQQALRVAKTHGYKDIRFVGAKY
jgi:biopolymer transport protein ExbD